MIYRYASLPLLLLATATVAAPPPRPGRINQFIIYDGLQYRPEQLETAMRSPVPVAQPVYEGNAIRISLSADSHYYLHGAINGFPVVFMLDTGATHTAIPAAMARNAGIRVGMAMSVKTAAGPAEIGRTENNTVHVGPIEVPGVSVTLAPLLATPVLGMDVLRNFNLTQVGDQLWLRPNR